MHTHTHVRAYIIRKRGKEMDRYINLTSLLMQHLGCEGVLRASLGISSLGVDVFAEQSGSACHTCVQVNNSVSE